MDRYIFTACPACREDDPAGCLMVGYGVGDIHARCRHCGHAWYWQSGAGIGGRPDIPNAPLARERSRADQVK